MNLALFLFLRANRRHLADLMLAGLVLTGSVAFRLRRSQPG
jgi:hypothetical protein